MLHTVNNSIVFDYKHCQQCGTCLSVCPKHALYLSMRADGTSDIMINYDLCVKCQKCIRCCPVNINNDDLNYLSKLPTKEYCLSHSKNDYIRKTASSGGATKTIIINALQNDIVDGVYTLKKTDSFPFAEGEFFTKENPPTYESMPNSVYHSVMMNANLYKVKACRRLLIVGTSCQLKGLKAALRGKYQELYTICIFCKQQKTTSSTSFLSKESRLGKYIKEDVVPQYRGGGWPGVVSLSTKTNKTVIKWEVAAQLPFGRRLWTVKGCRVCGDPFGTDAEADITMMDPWVINRENDLGDTLIIIHTANGRMLVEKTVDLESRLLSYDEIKPALGEVDIKRKRLLVPFFKGHNVPFVVKIAGILEMSQVYFLETLLKSLPSMPVPCYKVIKRVIPDFRNILLK